MIHDLYFNHNLSQKVIAERLGISESTVGRAFKKNGWTARAGWRTRPSKSVDPIKIWQMYFEEGLTQREIVEKLGISRSRIINVFKTHGWKSRPASPRGVEIVDPYEVHRLYFEEGLSQRRIAGKLGLKSVTPIVRLFREMGWKFRHTCHPGGRRRTFVTDEARKKARIRRDRRRSQRLHELRESLFGSECRICDVSKDENLLHIHRKDCEDHERNFLWIVKNLRSLDPNDYAALCVACHRGVHWLERNRGTKWTDIEKFLKDGLAGAKPSKETIALPDERTPSSKAYERAVVFADGEIDLREALFGNECYFCGSDYECRRLTIHRKDGRPHDFRLLEKERYLRTLKPDEWVALCQKCHRYVHWAMNRLHLKWADLKLG
ncbi:MAG: hypothetical protein ACFFER_13305 [Candidatus Thorarchaeota archaeon]